MSFCLRVILNNYWWRNWSLFDRSTKWIEIVDGPSFILEAKTFRTTSDRNWTLERVRFIRSVCHNEPWQGSQRERQRDRWTENWKAQAHKEILTDFQGLEHLLNFSIGLFTSHFIRRQFSECFELIETYPLYQMMIFKWTKFIVSWRTVNLIHF